ncbi:MAG TPA: hypothetical protein VGL72_02925 [Bryobacteraceae bacterium]|jgi:hypothetical protein
MAQANGVKVTEERRLLVDRVSASSYFNRSARLRELLQYLAQRVLEDETCQIREQEIGHQVFGRSLDYDTNADDIVRVHASMLRSRLDQYFLAEGLEEPEIIRIPDGNYAPVFHIRHKLPIAPEPTVAGPETVEARPSPWLLWTLAVAAILGAALTLWLLARVSQTRTEADSRLAIRQFWSHVFSPNRATDIVLDDAAVALYQELTGKPIPLSEYFDRSYLRGLPAPETAAEPEEALNPQTAETLVLRRQSSFSSSSFYWKLTQMPESAHWQTLLRFARDYSFRELKSNNVILLGNSRTNPWVQQFESRMGLRWQYDKSSGAYFPADTGGKAYRPAVPRDVHEGYFSLVLLPNLGGTGNVLIVTATGGSALNAAADFLADETSVAALRTKLAGGSPYFEALIRLPARNIILARHVKVTGQ